MPSDNEKALIAARGEVRVLVLTGLGLNCEVETAHAFRLCGAQAELMHLSDMLDSGQRRRLLDYHIIAMIGGFVFLAPLTCIGLYAISAQLERGQDVSIVRSLRAAFRRYIGNEMLFAIVLLVIFMVWARAG